MRAAWDGPDLDDDDDDIGEVPAVAPPSSSGDMMPGACYVRACLSFLRQHGVLLPDDTSPSRFMEDLHHALMHTDPAPGCARRHRWPRPGIWGRSRYAPKWAGRRRREPSAREFLGRGGTAPARG